MKVSEELDQLIDLREDSGILATRYHLLRAMKSNCIFNLKLERQLVGY